MADTFITLVTH